MADDARAAPTGAHAAGAPAPLPPPLPPPPPPAPPPPPGNNAAPLPLPPPDDDVPPPPPPLEEDGGLPPEPADGPAAAPEAEEDPLVAAARAAAEAEAALAAAADVRPDDDPALKAFYADMRSVDRENAVNAVLGAFKLNPFEALALRFDAPPEAVRRAYRQVSLAVHPDKCAHPRAKDAFEAAGAAQKELLDERRRAKLDFFLNHAREEVRKEWAKAAKRDVAARAAALAAEGGAADVAAAWEAGEEFHAAWKAKARDVLARAEWRRRKMAVRIAEEEARGKEEYVAEKAAAKRKRDEEKAWETTRDERVGSWRAFAAGKGGGKKKKSAKGGGAGLRPPKAKEEDADKAYIARPVGEQFRPAPPKRQG